MMTERHINNKEYWESRKRPGEEITDAGFVMADGFEMFVTFGMVLFKQFRRAIEENKSFRFELRWDAKARRTFYCFFDATKCDEAYQPMDPSIPCSAPEFVDH